jgi:hypothetical protein
MILNINHAVAPNYPPHYMGNHPQANLSADRVGASRNFFLQIFVLKNKQC